MTLTELLVAIAIVAVLSTVLIVTGGTVQKSFKITRAKNQFSVLSTAIELYTQAWKPWVAPNGTKLSEKGLPDWSGRRLFPRTTDPLYPGTFDSLWDINDPSQTTRLLMDDDDDVSSNGRRDVEFAGECLAWGLLTEYGSGPFLKDPPQGLVNFEHDERYPARGLAGEARKEMEFEDPWDAPIRFMWVARDPQTHSGWRTVLSSDYLADDPPATNGAEGGPLCVKAEGFVLESAGPDGKFGNEWRRWESDPAGHEASESSAADNIVVKP